MTIATTTTTVRHGLAKRLAALGVAAATLLAGGMLAVGASADDPAANVAANAASGNDNAPDVQVSYTTSWQGGANALNDGVDESSDYLGWGTWGNTSASETATYVWNRAVTTSSSTVSYYTNVVTGDGGVLLPERAEIQYLDEADGEYKTVPNLTVDDELPAEPDQSNYGPYTYTFDEITTTSLRLVLTKRAADNKGITVGEWQVLGVSADLPVDPGDPDAFLYVQEIALRTTPGVDPSGQLPERIWVTPENGPSVSVPVIWDAIAAEDYATAGTTATIGGVTVAGTYDGVELPAGAVGATLGVYETLDADVTGVEYVSTITTPGKAPVFQDTVALTYADGSVQSGAAVTWGAIDPADYAEAEQMGLVEGDVEGTDIRAEGMFFVVEPSPADAEPIVAIDFNSDALNATGWYTSTPKLTVSADRGVSDVAIVSIEYRIGGGEWAAYTGPVDVTGQGEVEVSARATDANGNVKETSQTISIDTNAPTTEATETSRVGKDVVVELTAADGDNGSGVTRTLYSTGPSNNPKSNENTMWGTYTDADKVKVQLSADHDTYVHFYSQDAAGHSEDYRSLNLGTWDGVEPTIPAESVAISGTGVADGKLELTVGSSVALTATVAPVTASDKTVTWASSDPSVATVDADGTVKAVAAGTASITATTANGKSASVAVSVAEGGTTPEPEPEPEPEPTPEPEPEPAPGEDGEPAPAPNDPDQLGDTGASVAWAALLAALLVSAGLVLVRRRKA